MNPLNALLPGGFSGAISDYRNALMDYRAARPVPMGLSGPDAVRDYRDAVRDYRSQRPQRPHFGAFAAQPGPDQAQAPQHQQQQQQQQGAPAPGMLGSSYAVQGLGMPINPYKLPTYYAG